MAGMTQIQVYFNPGKKYKIIIPDDKRNRGGFFPRKEDVIGADGKLKPLDNGFYVENEEVGEITPMTDKVGVIYEHKYPAENNIYFYSLTGEVCIIIVGKVPVHDHSSIPMGGPAYGTYFSDKGSGK
jgi:hypothetical protein